MCDLLEAIEDKVINVSRGPKGAILKESTARVDKGVLCVLKAPPRPPPRRRPILLTVGRPGVAACSGLRIG